MTNQATIEQLAQRPVHEQAQHAYTLPSRLYLDPEAYEQEKHKIFNYNWHYAGHLSQLSKTGDYLTATVADESIFMFVAKTKNYARFTTSAGTAPIGCLRAAVTLRTWSARTTPGPMP